MRAHKFSGKAAEKIAAAGGTAESWIGVIAIRMHVMDSLKNIFAVSDLRNRVLFTLGLLAVYRVGHHITTPGVNAAALDELARQTRTRCSASTTCSRAATCRR